MAVTITFIETRSVTNPEGVVSTVDAWRGDRSDDAATVELTFAAGTVAATVQTAMDSWFAVNMPLPAAPTVPTSIYIPLFAAVDKTTGEVKLLDMQGKPFVGLLRESNGAVRVTGYDTDGTAAMYRRQQVVVANFRGTKTAKVDWPVAFKKPPVISLTLSDASATVPYKYSATTTSAVIRLQNAYTGQIEITAHERA